MQTVKIDEFQSQQQRKRRMDHKSLWYLQLVGASVKKESTKHKTLVQLRTTTLLQQFAPPQAEDEEWEQEQED